MWASYIHPEYCHSPLRLFRCSWGELEHVFETTRRVHHQQAGKRRFDGKGVRDTTRKRNECTRFTEMVFPSDVEARIAGEPVPAAGGETGRA
jgi:hypothetical protein